MVVFQTKGFTNTERSTCQSLFVSCAQGSTESVTEMEGRGWRQIEHQRLGSSPTPPPSTLLVAVDQ